MGSSSVLGAHQVLFLNRNVIVFLSRAYKTVRCENPCRNDVVTVPSIQRKQRWRSARCIALTLPSASDADTGRLLVITLNGAVRRLVDSKLETDYFEDRSKSSNPTEVRTDIVAEYI